MKPLVILILGMLSSHLSGQVKVEKVGAFVGMHRVIASYNYLVDGDWRRKRRSLKRHRIGAKATYPIAGRISLETGLLIDNLIFRKDEDRPSYFIYDRDNALILLEHHIVKIGVPITLLLRTYQTEECVTFIKLTCNNQAMVYEQEQFLEETTDAISTRSTAISDMSSSRSGFDFSNTDIEFSFGTYFNIRGVDAQFAIEPKFSLYNYVATNSINTSNDLNLYDAHSRIYGAIGIELTMYKVIQ